MICFLAILLGDFYTFFLRWVSAMVQTWSLQTDELELAFPRIAISEEDLLRANLDEEEIGHLTEEDRQKISETLRSHYIHDLFWPEMKHLATIFLQAKTESDG